MYRRVEFQIKGPSCLSARCRICHSNCLDRDESAQLLLVAVQTWRYICLYWFIWKLKQFRVSLFHLAQSWFIIAPVLWGCCRSTMHRFAGKLHFISRTTIKYQPCQSCRRALFIGSRAAASPAREIRTARCNKFRSANSSSRTNAGGALSAFAGESN